MTCRFEARYLAALLLAVAAQANVQAQPERAAEAPPEAAAQSAAAQPEAAAQSEPAATAPSDTPPQPVPVDTFFAAAELDEARSLPARQRIAAAWQEGDAALLVDILDILRRTSFVDPISWVRIKRLADFLEEQTGQDFGLDVNAWHEWLWSRPYRPHPHYGAFKGMLYSQLDPRFADFFQAPVSSRIRLDEIEWGGVGVNGIPPLDHPRTVAAADAAYLADGDVVFGVSIGDETRAYPKRILGWHEMALDRLGGREITLVYCTLCGTAIPYDSRVGGQVRTFGTSGFLYQSNKLMFDAGTHSLWSSIEGQPVVGPLADSGLSLTALPIVTTTWGEWKRLHPQTSVLSLDTGYRRDYSEGAAYRDYFATDRLMFNVAKHDARLPNKAEVLVLRLPGEAKTSPIAISAQFLSSNPVYELELGPRQLVVVTSPAGANRVYLSGGRRFVERNGADRVVDADGRAWQVAEDALVATFDSALRLPRVPAHRAFWFGWYAQHPDTRLIAD